MNLHATPHPAAVVTPDLAVDLARFASAVDAKRLDKAVVRAVKANIPDTLSCALPGHARRHRRDPACSRRSARFCRRYPIDSGRRHGAWLSDGLRAGTGQAVSAHGRRGAVQHPVHRGGGMDRRETRHRPFHG